MIEHLPILAFLLTGCVSVSSFIYLVGIANSVIESSIYAITAGIKKNQPMINNKGERIMTK